MTFFRKDESSSTGQGSSPPFLSILQLTGPAGVSWVAVPLCSTSCPAMWRSTSHAPHGQGLQVYPPYRCASSFVSSRFTFKSCNPAHGDMGKMSHKHLVELVTLWYIYYICITKLPSALPNTRNLHIYKVSFSLNWTLHIEYWGRVAVLFLFPFFFFSSCQDGLADKGTYLPPSLTS